MEKESLLLAMVLELLRGDGDLHLTEDGKRGLYEVLSQVNDAVSYAANSRKEAGKEREEAQQ